jgi:hypothetical protein
VWSLSFTSGFVWHSESGRQIELIGDVTRLTGIQQVCLALALALDPGGCLVWRIWIDQRGSGTHVLLGVKPVHHMGGAGIVMSRQISRQIPNPGRPAANNHALADSGSASELGLSSQLHPKAFGSTQMHHVGLCLCTHLPNGPVVTIDRDVLAPHMGHAPIHRHANTFCLD